MVAKRQSFSESSWGAVELSAKVNFIEEIYYENFAYTNLVDLAMLADNYVVTVEEVDDNTAETNPGGIDFNLNDLEIQSYGNRVQIPLPGNNQEYLDIQINNLVPFIFKIIPVTNLPLLLGEFVEELDEFSLSQLN